MNRIVCLSCKTAPHSGMTCDENRASQRADDASLHSLAAHQSWSQCPRCKYELGSFACYVVVHTSWHVKFRNHVLCVFCKYAKQAGPLFVSRAPKASPNGPWPVFRHCMHGRRHMVERRGCKHMTCRCSHIFCYGCGAPDPIQNRCLCKAAGFLYTRRR